MLGSVFKTNYISSTKNLIKYTINIDKKFKFLTTKYQE